MQEEQWRTVPGFEDYEVSDLGRVRSWNCTRGERRRNPKLRKLWTMGGWYPTVTVSVNGKSTRLCVHVLVLEAFVGPRPAGFECRHLDGDKQNNALSNLAWGTPKENCADRTLHGTENRGERNNQAKLTEAEVLAIRASSESSATLAERYRISAAAVNHVRARRSWAWL